LYSDFLNKARCLIGQYFGEASGMSGDFQNDAPLNHERTLTMEEENMDEYSPIEHPEAVALTLAKGVLPLLADRKGQTWHFSVSAELSEAGSLELTSLSWRGPDGRNGSLRAASYPEWAVKKLAPGFTDSGEVKHES
jgi:hypothetical protein